ncbi:MAG: N-acetylmuramoyl-L-alanine amidase [Acidobacteria bacterium]|nr:N-acetylmuramoyl-L-alanine amidase [Acidobacteriota bacterium]
MSSTPQDARAGWGSPQVLPPPAPPQPAGLEGHDPLEVLLAFARILEQAVARRFSHHSSTEETALDEYFELDEVLWLVAARAAAITGADGIAIALASKDAIVCRASSGRISPEPGVRLDPNSGFSGACLRYGQTVRCDDSETDSRVNPRACRSLGARSMLAVPLIAKGRVVGLIEAFSAEPLGFNQGHLDCLNFLGELVLAAIHPAEQDRLAQFAEHILPGPPQGEPEKPAEEGWTFPVEEAGAPRAVEVCTVDPAVSEPLAAIFDILPEPAQAEPKEPVEDEWAFEEEAGAPALVEVYTVDPPVPDAGAIFDILPEAEPVKPVKNRWAFEEEGGSAPAVEIYTVDPPVLEPPPPGIFDILAEPVEREPEKPVKNGWTFQEEEVSAPAVEIYTVDPPVWEPLPAATFKKEAEAEAYAPPFRKATVAGGTRMPALIPGPLAGPSGPARDRERAAARWLSFFDEEHSYSGLALVAALALLAFALGWAWVYHAEQLTSANTNHSALSNSHRKDSREPGSREQPAPKPGATPTVTGVRHWSSAASSTIVLDVDDQVEYDMQKLDNPPRVYFDLPDTKTAPGLLNQAIEVDDAFVKRLRIAETPEGVTRVVVDTKGITEVSAKVDSNPYRLTIDVHKPAASSPALTKPSPAIAGPRKKKTSRAAPWPLSGLRVVLDAGHGGWDLGTVGTKGLLEKDLVLDIVERLGKLVEEKLGAEVIYTRQGDTYLPLEKRAEIANLERADLFLSVHANYSDLASARGIETYYSTNYSPRKALTVEDNAALKYVDWARADIREKVANAHRLASDVQDALYEGIAARNSGIRNRGVKEAGYVVLTGTQMPAILAEVSFVSSPADEDNLGNSNYRQMIAEALCRGLARYRSQVRQAKLGNGAGPAANSE